MNKEFPVKRVLVEECFVMYMIRKLSIGKPTIGAWLMVEGEKIFLFASVPTRVQNDRIEYRMRSAGDSSIKGMHIGHEYECFYDDFSRETYMFGRDLDKLCQAWENEMSPTLFSENKEAWRKLTGHEWTGEYQSVAEYDAAEIKSIEIANSRRTDKR